MFKIMWAIKSNGLGINSGGSLVTILHCASTVSPTSPQVKVVVFTVVYTPGDSIVSSNTSPLTTVVSDPTLVPFFMISAPLLAVHGTSILIPLTVTESSVVYCVIILAPLIVSKFTTGFGLPSSLSYVIVTDPLSPAAD